jgi:hypothetical protein
VLPLSELLAVRRCAEPSLPEGAGIWVSTQAMPAVSLSVCVLGVCYVCAEA